MVRIAIIWQPVKASVKKNLITGPNNLSKFLFYNLKNGKVICIYINLHYLLLILIYTPFTGDFYLHIKIAFLVRYIVAHDFVGSAGTET